MNLISIKNILPKRLRIFAKRNILLLKKISYNLVPKEITVITASVNFTMLGDRTRDHGVGKDYIVNQQHEPVLTDNITAVLRNVQHAVFWDIGAAYGYYTVLAGHILKDMSHIHAFEADTSFLGRFRFLRINNKLYLNDRAILNSTRVSDRDDNEHLTLDNYARTHGCPTVVKIDVDGAEDSVLYGMKEVIERCKPYIFLEIHYKSNYPSIMEAVSEVVNNENYDCYICINHRTLNAEMEKIHSLAELPSKFGGESASEKRACGDYMLFLFPG